MLDICTHSIESEKLMKERGKNGKDKHIFNLIIMNA